MQSERLIEFFSLRQCPGVIDLISHLSDDSDPRGHPVEVGSSSIHDEGRVLDEITLAMRRFGFGHSPATHETCEYGCHSEWHKAIYIGRPASRDGKVPAISPLDWLELFSQVADGVSEPALRRFDLFCGNIALMFKSDATEIISNL
jgi:hypothetical protein